MEQWHISNELQITVLLLEQTDNKDQPMKGFDCMLLSTHLEEETK